MKYLARDKLNGMYLQTRVAATHDCIHLAKAYSFCHIMRCFVQALICVLRNPGDEAPLLKLEEAKILAIRLQSRLDTQTAFREAVQNTAKNDSDMQFIASLGAAVKESINEALLIGGLANKPENRAILGEAGMLAPLIHMLTEAIENNPGLQLSCLRSSQE